MAHYETVRCRFVRLLAVSSCALWFQAARCGRVLRRILRYFGVAGGGAGVVLVGDLQVVLCGHRRAVADPSAHHMRRVSIVELGFSGRPQVVPQLRPRKQAGAFDDPGEVRPDVRALAVAGDNEFSPTVSGLERLAQVRQQFREQRDDPRSLALVVLGFRRCDGETPARPRETALSQEYRSAAGVAGQLQPLVIPHPTNGGSGRRVNS